MPALKNQRQERFCQLVKQGIPPYRAYPGAGYKPDDGAPYRLSGNVRIKRRLAEITRSLAMKTRVTVETITEDLDRIMAGAEAAAQFGAAKGAVDTKAKLHGLLVDRKEQGAPGEFSGLQSEAETIAKVRAELGDDAASALAKALEQADNRVVPAEDEVDPLPPIEPTNSGNSTLN